MVKNDTRDIFNGIKDHVTMAVTYMYDTAPYCWDRLYDNYSKNALCLNVSRIKLYLETKTIFNYNIIIAMLSTFITRHPGERSQQRRPVQLWKLPPHGSCHQGPCQCQQLFRGDGQLRLDIAVQVFHNVTQDWGCRKDMLVTRSHLVVPSYGEERARLTCTSEYGGGKEKGTETSVVKRM